MNNVDVYGVWSKVDRKDMVGVGTMDISKFETVSKFKNDIIFVLGIFTLENVNFFFGITSIF